MSGAGVGCAAGSLLPPGDMKNCLQG